MKKYLSILVGLITSTSLVFAANDVTLTGTAAQLSVSGYTLVVTGSQRVIDSIAVGDSSFDLTLSPGATFGVTSADRRNFTVSDKTYVRVGVTCTSDQSELSVESTVGEGGPSNTVTITPSTSQNCSSTSDGGGGGGGGGGGTGSVANYNYGATPANPTVSPATPAASAMQNASSVAQSVSPAFNKDLVRGHKNDDVKRLQQLLSQDKSVYPEGLATGLFGPATEKAVKAFQKKYGLPQVGRVGPATRAKLQEVFGSATAVPVAPTPSSSPAPVPATNNSSLQAQIQQLLNQLKVMQDQLKAKQSQ